MNAKCVAYTLGRAARTAAGWVCRCPVSSHGRGKGDRNPSLSITDGENRKLLVWCFAGCASREVLHELRARGLLAGNPDNVALSLPVAKPSFVGRDEARTEAAQRIWREAQSATGTIVETYFGSRPITMLPPPSLRFCPDLWHSEARQFFPAMVAGVQGPDGRLVAVHRTYLAADGSGKALVEPTKKILGPSGGGAVRLAKASETLQVAEGIETALAALQATAQPTWAALSTSGLRTLELPGHVRRVTILADGDDPGEAAAQAAAERWFREGREVRIARPPRGYDFADVLAGKATAAIRSTTA